MSQLAINTVAEICYRQGIRHAVISPGSRSAPLTLAFAWHTGIDCKVIRDERSAAFIALGMAQETSQPVVLICTSGTAGLNYAPAVAEAYWQKIPLLVLTADRPAKWIGHQDGQTIYQEKMYGRHAKAFFSAPEYLADQSAKAGLYESVYSAIEISRSGQPGPVQINFPFPEPFYPPPKESFAFDKDLPATNFTETEEPASGPEFDPEDFHNRKVLIICGQHAYDQKLSTLLERISKELHIPVVGDVLSNLHDNPEVIRDPDIILASTDAEKRALLRPGLLITLGDSVISKNLKLYLRSVKPEAQWHVQPSGDAPDTYRSLTRVIRSKPHEFLHFLLENRQNSSSNTEVQRTFQQYWQQQSENARQIFRKFISNAAFGELGATSAILDQLPANSILQLGNSMPVRLANFSSVDSNNPNIEIRCNRGTSGIDGTNGTAVGNAFVTNRLVILLTGDVAFFYDRNAFWHHYDLSRLRIIILNNDGGGIFSMIKGPDQHDELKEYFLTPHGMSAERTAADHGLEYQRVDTKENLSNALDNFFRDKKKGAILEIKTDNITDRKLFRQFQDQIVSQ